jgi:DNA repair exonuclease SbcCD ATPase subunit
MITLQKLKWDNCFSYGSGNELQLDENIVTQIIGTNGMGKSSIPLIIEEVLYNKNSKGIKKADIPNRYINNGYNIYLSFSKDDEDYEITVNRGSTIKVKLEKDGEDISSHTATNTYKSIQDIIGIDFKTFSQLVYQNTNASLQFLTATDSNRKKFLIDLLHLEHYVELFDIFKEASKQSGIAIARITSKLSTVEKWLEDNKLSDTSIVELLNFDIDTSKDEKELASLTIELQNISEKNKKISKNNQYKSIMSTIDIASINESSVKQLQSYDNLQSEVGSLNAIAAGAQRLLHKLEGLGDTCPTCEQSVDNSFKQSLMGAEVEKNASATNKMKELMNEIERIKENNSVYTANSKAKKDWEDLYRSIDHTLQSEPVDKGQLDSRISSLQKALQDSKDTVSKLSKENELRTKRNTRIQVIQEQTDEFVSQLNACQAELDDCLKLDNNLEVLKKAFSTNGLLAYKIENLVKELEELTNEYLGELSDGRFTLEFVVSNDKLNVQITDNGNIVDILALSSGELARVNTATLIAIRKLMSSISKSKINVLFLDEVINVLDDAGREKMVEVLLGEDLNTYIVSHGWAHPLLAKIEVVKNGNVSGLE